jgi:DNA-binding transcriptional regulator GbsR (MarR family)
MSYTLVEGIMTKRSDSPNDPSKQWDADRTTFQRVYDILVGTTDPVSAQQFAEWARCSETGARQALEQLVEMGIAERTGTRPAQYQRNPSYFQWKRVETLAREHSAGELRSRLSELIEADQDLQETYGVPDPDAVVVSDDPVEDHETLHDRWEDLTEWRTIRRDITILKRAVQRAESSNDGRVQSNT